MSTDNQSRTPSVQDPPATPSRRQDRQSALQGTRRVRRGLGAGVAGGALVVISAFLPWLEFNGRVRSGWEIYDLYRTLGLNPAVISPLFGAGDFDVFFTGVLTLSLGVLSLLLLAGVLALNTRAPNARRVTKLVLAIAATVVIATALVLTVVNLRTVRLGSLGFEQSPIHYGLWVTFAGALAATIGLAVSIIGTRQPAPVQQVPVSRQPMPSEPLPTGSAPIATARIATAPPATAAPALVAPPAPVAPVPVQPAAVPVRPAPARQRARTIAILLFLVGGVGYGIANVADRSHAASAVQDERVLGPKNPVGASQALRARVRPVKGAFDTYAAASTAVAAARADVTTLFNAVGPRSAGRTAESAAAKVRLSRGIAAYGAAVGREQAARIAYDKQLSLLMAEVHR